MRQLHRNIGPLGLLSLVLGVLAGCSSSAGSDRCTGADCQVRTGIMPATGAGGAAGVGSSDGTATPRVFDNPNASADGPAMVAPPPLDDNAVPVGDGNCVEGQFCAPTSPDPDNCGTITFNSTVEVTVKPGNLLIIFDMSGSMGDQWPGTGGSKRDAARRALEAAIGGLQDQVSVGAIFFPTYACVPVFPPPPGGAVAPISDPLQINFAAGPQFLQTWNQRWAGPIIGGIGTPMNEAFDRADQAIASANLEGKLAVVAFTDGEPNCLADAALSGAPTMPEPQRAAGWLANQDIKTYVVGLPGAGGVQVLNQVAQSGGTSSYILPDNPEELEMRLREVVEETVSRGFDSCSIALDPPASVPEKLLMLVEEPGVMGKQRVPRDRGWSLGPQGVQVEITGQLCEQAMNGRFESITFEYACPDVEPPPPIPPLQ